jgi:hypothetical protein
MFAKGLQASHNFLKITTRESLFKTLSTSIYITAQSKFGSRRVQMPKRLASQLLGIDIPN